MKRRKNWINDFCWLVALSYEEIITILFLEDWSLEAARIWHTED